MDALPAGFDHALDLFRRLKPLNVADDVEKLCRMAPDMEDELRDRIDKPLTWKTCSRTGRKFLCCDYNRDGDYWRSPWSNELEPTVEPDDQTGPAGLRPSDRVRAIEIKANDAFTVYRDHYLRGGLASVYLWDADADFAGAVLLKNSAGGDRATDDDSSGGEEYGWDSIHGFAVSLSGTVAEYYLVSTIILTLCPSSHELGRFELAGSLVREQKFTFSDYRGDDSHVANIGRIVESMENRMRGSMEDIYFGKAQDITSNLRSIRSLSLVDGERAAQQEVIKSMQSLNAGSRTD